VIAVQEQKAEALRILQQRGGDEVGQETLADDPSWKELHLKLLAEQSNAQGLRARIRALESQHADLRQQLTRLNARAGQVARLVERVELLRNKYASYAEKREQGRIDQALLDEQISSLSIAQPPTYVVKPVVPKKGITLLIAAVLAIAAAVSLGVILECLAGTPAPWRHFAPIQAQGPVQLKSPDDEIAEVSRLVEQAIH
jgi:polysaccharide biosynthesis protein PslE